MVCDDLSKKAEKSTLLAKDRVRTVNVDNAAVAKAQLRTLAEDIVKFRDFCKKHRMALDKAPQSSKIENASSAIQLLTLKIQDSVDGINAAEAAITALVNPSKALAASKNSTPSKTLATSKKSTPMKTSALAPLLSPIALARNRTITEFFSNINSTAAKLGANPNFDEGFVKLLNHDAHERTIRLLERQYHTEEELHALILEERERQNSTASRFMGEAYEADGIDGSSQGSDPQLSHHDSDDLFLRSQGSESKEELHPRHALAHSSIREAQTETKAPEVVTLEPVKITDLPKGYCAKGHEIRFRPSFKTGKSLICSCCKTSFKDNDSIFTCHCSTYLVCSQCLVKKQTHPPPPGCPSLACVGSCTLRYKPL